MMSIISKPYFSQTIKNFEENNYNNKITVQNVKTLQKLFESISQIKKYNDYGEFIKL